ncbi:MAG TPA: hypothetical protein GXX36_12205 [Clostridiaceae bacterium]|nr:hypothetical protein [Clostridiaceae bacterium]
MKLPGSKKIVHIIFVLVVFMGISLIWTVFGGSLHKGSAQEATANGQSVDVSNITVASVDYVDEKVNQLNKKIEKLEDLEERIDELTALVEVLDQKVEDHSTSLLFEVIELEAGQTLIAGASSEIILRAGKATAISGKDGDGLSDITSGDGRNLFTGDEIPRDHLLLVSRDDGRGLKAVSQKVYLLFKGTYEIK